MLLESYEEDKNKFHRGPLTIIILIVIFAGTALKEFQSIFIPLPSDATDDIAYEQALLFGRAKRAAGERASVRRSA